MNHNGALYGSPVKIKDNIPLHTAIYVIEMNNSTNVIEGIGMIKNENVLDKHYRIYNDIPSLILELDQNSDDEEDETNIETINTNRKVETVEIIIVMSTKVANIYRDAKSKMNIL